MVNFDASLPSITAWVRMARASPGTMGSTRATESHKMCLYQPKRDAEFTNRDAKLEYEKIRFPKVSSRLDFLSSGAIGKVLGLVSAVEA